MNWHRWLLDKMKLARGCEKCGYNEHPAALEWDHTDPTNKYTTAGGKKEHVSDMVGRYSLNTILEEIKKCRVLCANCHARVTHGDPR